MILAGLLWTGCAAPEGPPAPAGCPDRTERAFDASILTEGVASAEERFLGGGVVIADLDGDAILDVLIPGPDDVSIRLGRGDGTFSTGTSPPFDLSAAVGASAADYDGDGDLDVLVARYGAGDVLLANRGDGTFDDATAIAGIDGAYDSHGPAWGDYDGDGWLDLVIAGRGDPRLEEGVALIDTPADPTRLYRNRGDGTFEDRTADLPDAARDGYTFVASFVDLDRDGRLDLYFANDYPAWQTGLAVWNRAEGWIADDGSAGLNAYVAGMGLGLGDANGDGFDDLLLPAWDRVIWLESQGADLWAEATAARGLAPLPPHAGAYVGWGAELADFDNDTALDAWVAFGHLDTLADRTPAGGDAANPAWQRDLVWSGGPDGFTAVTDAWAVDDPGVGRGLAVADLDRDGWLDVVTRDLDGPVRVHLGRCDEAGWLEVRLADDGANRFGVGAVIRIETAGGIQQRTVRAGGTGLLSGGPPEVHFGLGEAASVDRVEVTWPDGAITAVEGPVAIRRLLTVERQV
nr:CRTAC1 family protein [Deltaproteobacteria bacterium]